MPVATVFVHDQNGTPIPGASVTVTDGYTGAGGETDANGYYVSPDLPIPTPMGFGGYMVSADYYTATSGAETTWSGDPGVIDLMLPLSTAMNYDITVIADQGGTTDPAPGHYTGTGVITVTAIPNSGYVFDHWNMNGAFLTTNTSFHTGATGTFEAVFAASTQGSSLSFNAAPTSGTLPFTSNFWGRLLDPNGAGIASKTIHLQVYSQTQGGFVDTQFTYQTDSGGNYSGTLSWQSPQVTGGQYQVRTRYAGD